jgi:hypothetical protein
VAQVDALREEDLRYREEIIEADAAQNYEQVDVVEDFAVIHAYFLRPYSAHSPTIATTKGSTSKKMKERSS